MKNRCLHSTVATDPRWTLPFQTTRRQARFLYFICLLGTFVTMIVVYQSSYRTSGSKVGLTGNGNGLGQNGGNILREKASVIGAVNSINSKTLSSSDTRSFKAPIFYNCNTMDTSSDLLSLHPKRFNRKFKNPCWYEDLTDSAVYANNQFADYFHKVKAVFGELTSIWEKVLEEDPKPKRLRCLPYFFIAGQPKCGSTDLYQKISSHPDVVMPPIKESHWWGKSRYSWKSNYSTAQSFNDYTDLYDKVALYIDHVHDLSTTADQEEYHPLITGDASVSTLWDNDKWWSLKENCGATEPRFTNADYVHHFLPHAKIIVILRDPVDRLWSDYLYFQKSSKSADDFHKNVVLSIDFLENCLIENTLASCIYNRTIANLARVRLRVGIYYAYIDTWLNIYPRDQFFILRLEDYASNNRNVMKKVFKFLGLRDLTKAEESYILGQPVANARKKGDRKFGKMRNDTRKLIEDFYEPYNKKLSTLLNDKRFLWKDKSNKIQHTTENPVFDELGDYREKRSGRSVKRSSHVKLLKSLKQKIKECEKKKK